VYFLCILGLLSINLLFYLCMLIRPNNDDNDDDEFFREVILSDKLPFLQLVCVF